MESVVLLSGGHVKSCMVQSYFLCSYTLRSFHYGSYTVDVLCLQASATDYDLTGQIVWPGAELMNNYIIDNLHLFKGSSVIELGSGVGLTGLLCSQICREVVMTDHNDVVLKVLQRNIGLQQTNQKQWCHDNVRCEKLEWGNVEQLSGILERHPDGFDLVVGADICYQQSGIPFLFKTVQTLLNHSKNRSSRFILAYVSRTKNVDVAILKEANTCDLSICEIEGTRSPISGGVFEGLLYEVTGFNHCLEESIEISAKDQVKY